MGWDGIAGMVIIGPLFFKSTAGTLFTMFAPFLLFALFN